MSVKKYPASEYSDRIINLNRIEDRYLDARLKQIDKESRTSLSSIQKDINRVLADQERLRQVAALLPPRLNKEQLTASIKSELKVLERLRAESEKDFSRLDFSVLKNSPPLERPKTARELMTRDEQHERDEVFEKLKLNRDKIESDIVAKRRQFHQQQRPTTTGNAKVNLSTVSFKLLPEITDSEKTPRPKTAGPVINWKEEEEKKKVPSPLPRLKTPEATSVKSIEIVDNNPPLPAPQEAEVEKADEEETVAAAPVPPTTTTTEKLPIIVKKVKTAQKMAGATVKPKYLEQAPFVVAAKAAPVQQHSQRYVKKSQQEQQQPRATPRHNNKLVMQPQVKPTPAANVKQDPSSLRIKVIEFGANASNRTARISSSNANKGRFNTTTTTTTRLGRAAHRQNIPANT